MPNRSSSTPSDVIDISMDEIHALVERIRDRLDESDHALIVSMVLTITTLISMVRKKGATIARLRRFVGMSSSEKTATIIERPEATTDDGEQNQAPAFTPDADRDTPDPNGPDAATQAAGDTAEASHAVCTGPSSEAPKQEPDKPKPKPKRKGHGRIPASAYTAATHHCVTHEDLQPGQRCPQCGRGRLYEMKEPYKCLRIVGQAPLVAICWNCQRLRCSGCQSIYTATATDEAYGPKYSETASSMMALLRYSLGVPLNRLEKLQGYLQTPLPSSTQWDVVDDSADVIKPVFRELVRLAAQGSLVHSDDTYARVLEFMGKRRIELLKTGKLPDPDRTGLFTTAILSFVDNKPIVVFFTGRKHAGENMDVVLKQRADDLDAPMLMSDALDRNRPKDHDVVWINCLVHGRRNFVDQVKSFPEECQFLLETLGKVFRIDALCRRYNMSDDRRLRTHQRWSAPLMDKCKQWMTAQFKTRMVEPNSGLGKAMTYLLKRWDRFTAFLRMPGAPIHNNMAEQVLKMAICHRKNSYFYRSERGAEVGDLYMTLIHTAQLHRQNPFEYLNALLRNAAAVAEHPKRWLPWNYRHTLADTAAETSTDVTALRTAA